MENQRPQRPGSDDDQARLDSDTGDREWAADDTSIPLEDQPTQPINVLSGAVPSRPSGDNERLALLRRLTPTELAVLRHRCAGATTFQIGRHLGITHAETRVHACHVMDKLGVTYGREGTSLSRLTAFCPLTSQMGPSAGSGGEPVDPPSGLPSQRALDLTDADDQALIDQHGGGMPPPTDNEGRQRWIFGGILALVLLVALLGFYLLMDDDDGDDTESADEVTEEAMTQTAVAALEPTATVEEPTETPEPEPTPTEVPATETPEPEDTATETAEPEPTATEPEPTATEPDPEPTNTEVAPTATAQEDEPTATQPAPPPAPSPGELAYEADWSADDDEWILTNGWAIEDGELVTTGPDVESLLAPFQAERPDYAIELELVTEDLRDCTDRVGIFARVTEESAPSEDVLTGYAGSICGDEWHIDAVLEDDRESLASGDRVGDNDPHVYRLEVIGDQIRLFIDDDFVGEATDDRWSEAGRVGIYIDGDSEITVTAFRVFTLETSS